MSQEIVERVYAPPPFEGKKLFMVEIQDRIMTLAKNKEEAEEIARNEVDGMVFDWSDARFEASEAHYIPHDWRGAIPYGEQDEYTCDEIKKMVDEYEATRPPTKVELENAGQLTLEAL